MGHAIAQEDSEGGAWRLDLGERSCSLGVRSAGGFLSLLSVPEWFIVVVKLGSFHLHGNHVSGPGTLSIAPAPPGGRQRITLRFAALDPTTPRELSLLAALSRKEFLDLIDLMDRAVNDPDGAILFDYGGAQERFPTRNGTGRIAPMRACAEKH
jgi:hypothetical protein